MFLLVSVRHVGAHPGEHQHGVSIQISINLGKTFLRISRIWNIPLTWILARVFTSSFHFPDSELYLLNGFDFYFGLFWTAWRWKPAIRLLLNLPLFILYNKENRTKKKKTDQKVAKFYRRLVKGKILLRTIQTFVKLGDFAELYLR